MTQLPPTTPLPAETTPVVDAGEAQTLQFLRDNPEHIPAQFEGDPEKAMAAYKSLQAEYTKVTQENAELKKVESPPSEPTVTAPPAALETGPLTIPKAAERAPDAPKVVDWDAIQTEIRSKGKLEDTTLAELKSAGVSQSAINTFVAGQNAQVATERAKAIAIVGDEATLKSVLVWVGDNVPENEKAGLDAALASPQGEMVLSGLFQRYKTATKAEGGSPPEGSTASGTDAPPNKLKFLTQADMNRAISDPRYHQDHEYRDEVMKAVQELGLMNVRRN